MNSENLGKTLKKLEKDELVSLLLGVASLRKENMEWLILKLEGASGEEEAIAYFKGKIKACIFSDAKPDLKEARKLISNFRKISNDKEHTLELMVFYVETGTRLGEKYGDLYGPFSINPGKAEGIIIGGNLSTLVLLNGTGYMPSLKDSILFIEDDTESHLAIFDRQFQSLLMQEGFDGVNGLVIGRFQKDSKVTDDMLIKSIRSKPQLKDIPIIAGADFGHTSPQFTFPIGGRCSIDANDKPKIRILIH